MKKVETATPISDATHGNGAAITSAPVEGVSRNGSSGEGGAGGGSASVPAAVPVVEGGGKGRGGIRSTILMLRLRSRMITSVPLRVGIFTLLFLFGLGLYSSINLGYFVQTIALQDGDSVQAIYARAWISTLDAGYIASFGALAIGGAVAVAFFAPLTGTSTLSLATADDVLGVRPTRRHRFWDSLLINAFSGIGLLQFITLTAVTSLVTLDGNRFWAFVFTWLLWFVLVCVNTVMGFGLEFFQRKWGKKQKIIIGSTLLAFMGVAVLLDDQRGTDLFGLAKYYNQALRLSVETFQWLSVYLVVITFAVIVVLIFMGRAVAESALSLPERSSQKGSVHKSKRFGKSFFMISSYTLLRVIARTKEARKPLITITVLGLPVALFAQLDETLVTAFTMTIPLALSLSWGVNVFGLLGQGMYWIASQPKMMKYIPRLSFLFQILLSFLLLGVFWFAAFASDNLPSGSTQILIVSSLVNSVGAATVSSALSIFHPVRAPLKNKGDALVPPLTGLFYLLMIVIIGCFPGIFIVQQESANLQLLLTVIFTSVFVVFSFLLWKLVWDNPKVRSKAVSIVSVE